MNWMIKVTIGMLLLATLFIALGVAIIRANEYRPQTIKANIQNEAQKAVVENVGKSNGIEEKIKPKK